MNDLIRTDTVFGKRANIVGNISADLVLESLGKIYIKSRNSSHTLEEVIKTVIFGDVTNTAASTLIVEGLENVDISSLKEGLFIYDKLSNILYLWLDNDFLELINVAPEGTGYVKRSGDTMTGRLTINVPNGAPMHVNSSVLVKNFNANYLQGETADAFTRRHKDELITGKWTFQSPTKFLSNTLFALDIVVNGSVGSSSFASGFGGYGWRMDADTNTLTVDNLVVRKLMRVYEMVINRISATNGSLWVTNAGKVVEALKLYIYNLDFFDLSNANYLLFLFELLEGQYFIKLTTTATTFYPTLDALMYPSGNTVPSKECFTADVLKAAKVIHLAKKEDLNTTFPTNEFDELVYSVQSLFDPDFKILVCLPIVTRKNYGIYTMSENYQKECEKEIALKKNNDNYLDFSESVCRSQWLSKFISDVRTTYGVTLSGYITDIKGQLISLTRPYYKYFGDGDFYVVNFDDDEIPVFKPGDLLRCQKWTHEGIKYYDALVCNILGDYSYIILTASSILDTKTYIEYDDNINPQVIIEGDKYNMTLYEQTSKYLSAEDHMFVDDLGNIITPTEEQKLAYLKEKLLGIIQPEDSLVLMGNFWNALRQNAVYITSTDDGAPYNEVLSGLNRPDYSVIYYVPTYKTLKLYKKALQGANDIEIPFTGDYYILESKGSGDTLADYALEYITKTVDGESKEVTELYKVNDAYTAKNNKTIWLSECPNANTKLIQEESPFKILLEDGGYITLESGDGVVLKEESISKLKIMSTRTTRARFGNLDGIIDETFPVNKLPYGYGLYGQNVFLTGEFYLNNGTSVAEIGEDAITFAMAASDALNNSLDILEKDFKRADTLLQNNVYKNFYNIGDLNSAGFRIVKGLNGSILGLVLWGNQILIATNLDEFDGTTPPTALFLDGKIISKFIEAYDIHSREVGINTPYIYKYGDVTLYRFSGYVLIGNDLYEYQTYYYTTDPTVPYEVNGERIKDTDVTSEPLFYRWHLKEDGSGYLGSGNLSWDKEGNLDFKGNIYILNGSIILCIDNNNNAGLSISSNYYDTAGSWLNNINYRLLYVNNKETDSVIYNCIINSLSVTLASLSLHVSGSARGAQPTIDISVVYSDSTSETINWDISSNNTITISNGILISSISLTYTGPGYLSGTIRISSDIISEIGCNFIGIYPKNNSNFINKNLFWVGSDKIYMGSSNYSLELKDNGIFLLLKEWNSGNDAIDYYNSSPISEINLMSLIPQNKVKIINFDSNIIQTLNINNSSPKIFLIQLPENNPLANKTIILNSSEVANGTIIIISHGLGFTNGLADYNIKIKTNTADVESNNGLFILWNKQGESVSTSEIQLINEPLVLMALSKERTNNLIISKYVYWKSLSSKY